MSHLLLPTEATPVNLSNIRHKPTEIPRQLFYLIRGGTDAVEALELFLELLPEPLMAENKTMLEQPGYLAFDAHVGDTACQLRACMLLEVTKYLKSPESKNTVASIRSTLFDLRSVTEGARQLMLNLLDLDWNKIRAGGLEELKVPKAGLTTDELLTMLGWVGVRTHFFSYGSRSGSSESLVSQDSYESMESSLYSSNEESGTDSLSEWESATSDDDCEIQGVNGGLFGRKRLVKFIVYSYVLSKYKQLTSIGGVYRATLKPELAIERGQSLAGQAFGRQFVRPNKRAISEEFVALQRYISDFSCEWLGSQARKSRSLHPDHHSLLRSTIRTSAKGVSSASSYVGYLVLRSLWAEKSYPIIIMTTRFCRSGFHRNYFRVATHIKYDHPSRSKESPTLPHIAWHLTRLEGEDLKRLSQTLRPHIMISGNSIDGEASDYYSQLATSCVHDDEECCDNEGHCVDMLASDQDRVAQAIFAEHRHYAFELSGQEAILGEEGVVQRLMYEYRPGLSNVWATSKQEVAHLGAGPSYKLYMWQHVALESPARFLARVEGSNRPWIISAAV